MSNETQSQSTQTARPPSPMEFGSMPLDPFYTWGISYEPVEVLIEHTAAYIEELALDAYQTDTTFTEDELVEQFQAFFQQLVETGVVREVTTSAEERRRWSILSPRKWAKAQNARIKRIVMWWKAQDDATS